MGEDSQVRSKEVKGLGLEPGPSSLQAVAR